MILVDVLLFKDQDPVPGAQKVPDPEHYKHHNNIILSKSVPLEYVSILCLFRTGSTCGRPVSTVRSDSGAVRYSVMQSDRNR